MTGYGVSGSSALLNATYDSDGLRASKTSSSGTTYYLYDEQDHPVVELNSSGTATFVTTFGDNGLLSRRDVSGGVTTYYAFDPQGSAVDVMQATPERRRPTRRSASPRREAQAAVRSGSGLSGATTRTRRRG